MPVHSPIDLLLGPTGQNVETEVRIDGEVIVVVLPREMIGAYLVG